VYNISNLPCVLAVFDLSLDCYNSGFFNFTIIFYVLLGDIDDCVVPLLFAYVLVGQQLTKQL
jgi:hypothetical protein